MIHIDDLPANDIWPLIFKNLLIDDLFNCRSVNKKFKYFSEYANCIYRLIIGTYCYKYWYYNKELIEKDDLISFKFYQQFKLTLNLDKNLKYLIINKINDKKFNLKYLSYLINLESLEIKYLKLDENQFLNLVNLKFLSLEEDYNFELNLNTPKLMKIKLVSLNNINFISDPESIKHLITNNNLYDELIRMRIFHNLEIIELFNPKNIILDLMDIFIKLKKIKINDYNSYHLKSKIRILSDRKKQLNRNIDIYFKDVKIENISILYEFNNDLEYQIKNYNELDLNLSTIEIYVDFNQLTRCFNNLKNELPSSFFDRFSHLQSIKVSDHLKNFKNQNWFIRNLQNLSGLNSKLDQNFYDNLIWFIKNLRNLKILNLESSVLDQNFYDNLPDTIRILIISSETSINYDFILKFKNLITVQLFGAINRLDLALSSFLNLRKLEKFSFYFNDLFIEITRFKNKFNLVYNVNVIRELNYDQLAGACKIIGNVKSDFYLK